MRIIVASANIFRRELTSYVLYEAGYAVAEAHSLDALVAMLGHTAPQAIVLDEQLHERLDEACRAIRARTAAPILWLATAPHPAADGETLPWPYTSADLRARLAQLIEDDAPPPDCSRALGAG